MDEILSSEGKSSETEPSIQSKQVYVPSWESARLIGIVPTTVCLGRGVTGAAGSALTLIQVGFIYIVLLPTSTIAHVTGLTLIVAPVTVALAVPLL